MKRETTDALMSTVSGELPAVDGQMMSGPKGLIASVSGETAEGTMIRPTLLFACLCQSRHRRHRRRASVQRTRNARA
jgi:hypothetical protein